MADPFHDALDQDLGAFGGVALDHLSQAVIGVASGSLGTCNGYSLWLDDANGNAITCLATTGKEEVTLNGLVEVFDFQSLYIPDGMMDQLEMHANVPTTSAHKTIQSTLESVNGAVDFVHATQPIFYFYDPSDNTVGMG